MDPFYMERLEEERLELEAKREALLRRMGELVTAPLELREVEKEYEEVLVKLAVIRRELAEMMEQEGEQDETDGTG
jgi:hypothetical protein